MKVIIVTSRYPYLPGEQFLEEEIEAWALSGHDVTVVPLARGNARRQVPPGIDVDESMALRRKPLLFAVAALRTLGNGHVRDEMQLTLSRRPLWRSSAMAAARLGVRAQWIADGVAGILSRKPTDDVAIYTYWHGSSTYAAVWLKSRGAVHRVVTRAHGSDIWEDARPGGYAPYHRATLPQIDLVAPVSDKGTAYIQQRYGSPRRLKTYRLGVRVPTRLGPAPEAHRLAFVSVANCIPLKRIQKIVAALDELSRLTDWSIEWTHFGDGPLLGALRNLAAEKLDGRVSWRFAGGVPRAVVEEHFRSVPTDALISASRSEGIPVSMMEAIRYGVPVVSTDVGGTSEIVNDLTGSLVSPDVHAVGLAREILRTSLHFRDYDRRLVARDYVATNYDAQRNYSAFIRAISADE